MASADLESCSEEWMTVETAKSIVMNSNGESRRMDTLSHEQ